MPMSKVTFQELNQEFLSNAARFLVDFLKRSLQPQFKLLSQFQTMSGCYAEDVAELVYVASPDKNPKAPPGYTNRSEKGTPCCTTDHDGQPDGYRDQHQLDAQISRPPQVKHA